MKKMLSILLMITLCLSFCACSLTRSYRTIRKEEIEKVEFWDQKQTAVALSADLIDRFVKLYNDAEFYKSYDPAVTGGTPDFGFIINFKDGTVVRVNDWEGGKFEISKVGNTEDRFYVESSDLYGFAEELGVVKSEN